MTVRLVGLWTQPADAEAFEREYLGSHVPKLSTLAANQGVSTARCIDGAYFRLTEVSFDSLDAIHAALQDRTGQQILADANALADKFGIRLDVLVVAGPG
jgi:uncharacterized protein (TIGR02118 family)